MLDKLSNFFNHRFIFILIIKKHVYDIIYMFKYYSKEDSKYTGIVKQSSFALGAAYRNLDALILSAVVESGQYAIGFSYDLNVSKLITASTGRGGPEIFLRFVTPNPFLYQMRSKSKYNLK